MREVLEALLYWHEQGSGHIDESWWDETRRVLAMKPIDNITIDDDTQ